MCCHCIMCSTYMISFNYKSILWGKCIVYLSLLQMRKVGVKYIGNDNNKCLSNAYYLPDPGFKNTIILIHLIYNKIHSVDIIVSLSL